MNILEKVFTPNLTTKLIINEARNFFNSKPKLSNFSYLEMGCGSGEITYEIYELIKNFDITMTDISETAIDITKKRFSQFNNKNINIFTSDLFENVPKKKYDLIISDVAAISEDILPITDWYEGVSCKTGPDGLNLIKKILEESKNFMKKDSAIIYPALNLSNLNLLKKISEKHFKSTKKLASKSWPYNFNNEQKDILRSLKNKGLIEFKELSGTIVFNTEVWISTL